MTNLEFLKILKYTESCKSLYVYGCFGAPMNDANKQRYANYLDYNKKPERQAMILSATPDTFGFDCVCLVKGILWGWIGDVNAEYGGAKYKSNGVPDVGTDKLISLCDEVSNNFNEEIEPGELLWMNGHVGVYVGNGLAIECSPSWQNKVQYSACNRVIEGYNTRTWKKHGKLPYLEYIKEEKIEPIKYKYQVNSILKFIGTKFYYSANDEVGCPTEPNKKVKISATTNGLHKYLCYNVDIEKSSISMFGYVDETDLEEYVVTTNTTCVEVKQEETKTETKAVEEVEENILPITETTEQVEEVIDIPKSKVENKSVSNVLLNLLMKLQSLVKYIYKSLHK